MGVERGAVRQQEEVVLECLGLLHDVPVTLPVLQSTGIGSTLMAIRALERQKEVQ